jgi:hypothetical protein
MTGALLVDQGATVIKNFRQAVATDMQIVFDHRFCRFHNGGNFLDFEFIYLFEQQCNMLFQRQRFCDAGKAKSDMLPDFELSVWGMVLDMHNLREIIRVGKCSCFTNISNIFSPPFLGTEIVFCQVTGDGKKPGLYG